jgi:hypothetical protein
MQQGANKRKELAEVKKNMLQPSGSQPRSSKKDKWENLAEETRESSNNWDEGQMAKGDQEVKRVRLQDWQESQRDWVAGERAGGMMPGAWQMEKRWSQRLGVTLLRQLEARHLG